MRLLFQLLSPFSLLGIILGNGFVEPLSEHLSGGLPACISKKQFIFFFSLISSFSRLLPTSLNYDIIFYKLIRHLQWGTHLSLAGEKSVKNKLTTVLLMRA